MKNLIIRGTGILGFFLMLAIASVQAQTPSKIEVNVPFDFVAGKATLKAGAYSVKKTSGNAVIIKSTAGKTAVMVIAPLTLGSRDSKAGERLVFNKYGNQYFLSQVWLSVDSGRQVFPSDLETKAAREYKLASNNRKPERVEIAARGGR